MSRIRAHFFATVSRKSAHQRHKLPGKKFKAEKNLHGATPKNRHFQGYFQARCLPQTGRVAGLIKNTAGP
jgi:hypothetical protein